MPCGYMRWHEHWQLATVLHQWVITNHPHIVASYEEFNDANPFTPLKLDCAVPTLDGDDDLSGKLTAVVEYRTRYTLPNGSPATVKFGLGKDIRVNAILGLPQQAAWRMIIDLNENKCFCQSLGMVFPFEFHDAAKGLPSNIKFSHEDFMRPPSETKIGNSLINKNNN